MIMTTDKRTRFQRRREIIARLFALADFFSDPDNKAEQRGLLLELTELTTIETTLANVRKRKRA